LRALCFQEAARTQLVARCIYVEVSDEKDLSCHASHLRRAYPLGAQTVRLRLATTTSTDDSGFFPY